MFPFCMDFASDQTLAMDCHSCDHAKSLCNSGEKNTFRIFNLFCFCFELYMKRGLVDSETTKATMTARDSVELAIWNREKDTGKLARLYFRSSKCGGLTEDFVFDTLN